ncbi:MAG: bifunctional molybdenum cofactor biosynthesis protein MoaC/MoaB [Gammaproteobacteria bacterium]|nr:bifunctional molybdenum cofactor biosynthesis protein MoaC/MoaB [Gammaproteobacteria bacterium]
MTQTPTPPHTAQPCYQMVSVNKKQPTTRRAIAEGTIHVGESAFQQIKTGQLPKGDALALAEVAGIMAAKKTYELIPLCHPLGLDHVEIYTELVETDHAIKVYGLVSAFAKTGVEMEALMAVNAALLTIYDLTKMVEPALTLSTTRLLIKEGGKTGRWIHPDAPSELIERFLPTKPNKSEKENPFCGMKAAVVAVSDRAANKTYEDRSGCYLKETLQQMGAQVCDYTVLADDRERLTQHVTTLLQSSAPRLILLTGGTGPGEKDLTPEAIRPLCQRFLPGFGELLRHDSAKYYTKHAWLSRCFAGIIDHTLIIALPGSTNAVRESMAILGNLIPHTLDMIIGKHHD